MSERFFIISCKRYSELSSKRLDGEKLSSFSKISFFLHHFFCLFCRRYNRKITIIDKIAKNKKILVLDTKSKERIKDKIKNSL